MDFWEMDEKLELSDTVRGRRNVFKACCFQTMMAQPVNSYAIHS